MKDEYKAKGVSIAGVSNDPEDANGKFAGECGFSYPLICDTSLAVSVAYGAAADASAKSSSRIAVLVAKDGAAFTVKDVFMKVLKPMVSNAIAILHQLSAWASKRNRHSPCARSRSE